MKNPPTNEDMSPEFNEYRMSEDDIKNNIIRILNVFENDSGSPETEYDKIYLYHDGTNNVQQVTLARGYTECGGALWKVFDYYKELGGQYADSLLKYKQYSCKGILAKNQDFLKLIVQAAKEEESMREAQDKTFNDLYWNKGQDYFDKYRFTLPLSLAVIQDSQLHSGGMLKFLINKFNEKKPSDGGDEKKWIKSYVKARFNWLSNASELLRHTVYRPKFFLTQIENDNWTMDCSLIVNGVKVC